jgi:hypothetical protein
MKILEMGKSSPVACRMLDELDFCAMIYTQGEKNTDS